MIPGVTVTVGELHHLHLRRDGCRRDVRHGRHRVQQLLGDVVARAAVNGGGQLRDVDPAESLLHLEADSDPEDDKQAGEHAWYRALRETERMRHELRLKRE